MRQINNKGIQLIEEFESFSATPYLCPKGIPTIGIGTTRYEDGTKVTLKDEPITVKRAEELLIHHTSKDCKTLDSFLSAKGIKVGDNSFSALISFAYNLGLGPIVVTENALSKALLSQDPDKIREAFMLYTKITVKTSKGVIKKIELDGLKRRRRREVDLYFTPTIP